MTLDLITRVDITGEGHVSRFGAKLDPRMQVGVSITTGTPNATGLSGMVAEDIGKVFIFYGAGPSGGNLVTSILAYVSPSAVTLAHNASTTVSGGKIIYGTNDTVAFQTAIDAGSDPAVTGVYGGRVYFDGLAIISTTLLIKYKSMDFGGNGWGALSTDTSTANAIPGAGLIWAGAAGLPMIDVDLSQGSYLHDFRLFGNSSAKPIGIQIHQTAGGNHLGSYNNFARIWIGRMWVGVEPDVNPRTFSTAIYGLTSPGNDDYHRFETILVRGADVGFQSNDDQITYWDWQTVLFTECGIGFMARGDHFGRAWTFALNELDIKVGLTSDAGNVGRLTLDHCASEGCEQFALIERGELKITKGSWQISSVMDSSNVIIDMTSGAQTDLCMENFYLTTDGEPRVGTIVVGATDATNAKTVELINCKGFDQTNVLAQSGPTNDGRVHQRIVIRNAFHVSSSLLPYADIDVRMHGNDTLKWGQHDIDGKVRVMGGPVTIKRVPTAFWYAWPTDVVPTGSGATTYSYRMSAMSGGKETLSKGPVTCTNASSLNSTTNFNTVRWKPTYGADAYRIYGRTSGSELYLIEIPVSERMIFSGDEYAWKDDGSLTAGPGGLPLVDMTGGVTAEGPLAGQSLELRPPSSSVVPLLLFDQNGNTKIAIFEDGNTFLAAVPATSGTQVRNSPILAFESKRWNGSASVGEAIWATNVRRSATAGDYELRFVNQSDVVIAHLDADARLYAGAPNSAPTDGNIANSRFTFYLDQTGDKLKVRVRYSDGSYKTGEIALV